MPIFEYICADCDHRFELIVQGQDAPHCSACGSERLAKQLSVFAVNTKSASAAPAQMAPCGTCGDPRGPGSCSVN